MWYVYIYMCVCVYIYRNRYISLCVYIYLEFLNLSAIDTLDWEFFFEGEVCLAHYRKFSCIPGLYLLDAIITHIPVITIKNASRHRQMSGGGIATPPRMRTTVCSLLHTYKCTHVRVYYIYTPTQRNYGFTSSLSVGWQQHSPNIQGHDCT